MTKSFKSVDLRKKYLLEIVAYSILSAILLLLFGGASYVIAAELSHSLDLQTVFFWSVPIIGTVMIFISIRSLLNSVREYPLYLASRGHEIKIHEQNIHFSIGLLEGGPRRRLLEQKSAYAVAGFSKIVEFRVEPYLPQSSDYPSTQPYYVITTSDPPDKLWVARNPLKGQETRLFEEIKKHLNIQIQMNDQLR